MKSPLDRAGIPLNTYDVATATWGRLRLSSLSGLPQGWPGEGLLADSGPGDHPERPAPCCGDYQITAQRVAGDLVLHARLDGEVIARAGVITSARRSRSVLRATLHRIAVGVDFPSIRLTPVVAIAAATPLPHALRHHLEMLGLAWFLRPRPPPI